MNSDQRNMEARTRGTERSTVVFLTKHGLIAMTIFILAFMSANLWTEALIVGVAKLFNVKRDEIGFIRWLITALVFTFLVYFIIVYVIKIPITAAFSF